MLSACHHSNLPDGILDEEKMADFLAEAYQLEAYTLVMYHGNNEPSPEVRAAYDDILGRQGITRQQVEESLEYYSGHPAEYKAILDKVTARISEVQAPKDKP